MPSRRAISVTRSPDRLPTWARKMALRSASSTDRTGWASGYRATSTRPLLAPSPANPPVGSRYCLLMACSSTLSSSRTLATDSGSGSRQPVVRSILRGFVGVARQKVLGQQGNIFNALRNGGISILKTPKR